MPCTAVPALPCMLAAPSCCGVLLTSSASQQFVRPANAGPGITSIGLDLSPYITMPFSTSRCIEIDFTLRRRSGPSSEPQTAVRAAIYHRTGWSAQAGNAGSGYEAPSCTPGGCGTAGINFDNGVSDCIARFPSTQADATVSATVRAGFGASVSNAALGVYVQTGFYVEQVTVDFQITGIRCFGSSTAPLPIP
jgi:hypothetical protein